MKKYWQKKIILLWVCSLEKTKKKSIKIFISKGKKTTFFCSRNSSGSEPEPSSRSLTRPAELSARRTPTPRSRLSWLRAMALTVGTQRLGLQNIEATSSKSVVLVKLTDSALGAIAQFLRQRVGHHFFRRYIIRTEIACFLIWSTELCHLDKVIGRTKKNIRIIVKIEGRKIFPSLFSSFQLFWVTST